MYYIGQVTDAYCGIMYRRFCLSKILKNDKRFKYIRIKSSGLTIEEVENAEKELGHKLDAIIFSYPQGFVEEYTLKELYPRCKIFFEYTDNFSMSFPQYTNVMSKYATMISMSAHTSGNTLSYLGDELDKRLYPNGFIEPKRELTPVEGDKSLKYNTYAYCGQLCKIDVEKTLKYLRKTRSHLDIYSFSLIDSEFNFDAITSNSEYFTLKGYKSREELLELLPQYKGGLIPFKSSQSNIKGMLPLKFFDLCYAHLPTYFFCCDELKLEQFNKVAFCLDDVELGSAKVEDKDFEEILSKYNMEESLTKLVDDIYECLSK